LDFYKVGCHDSLSALSDALPVTPVTLSSKKELLTKKQMKKRSLQEKVLQKSWWST
jgi:hypothetical protein